MKLKNKKLIIVATIIVAIIVILVYFGIKLFGVGKSPYGDRCDQSVNYSISSKKIKAVKNKYKEIEEVKSVDVYTKLCTIKIIVNLKSDVDLETIKAKSTEVLGLFDEDELGFYDFALYVTSENKESEVYPINVSKHNSREDFAW